ncbi:MAG: GtrA family protein [Pseudomonadota bacterium]
MELYKSCMALLAGDRTHAQFIRFLLTGVVNTLFSYCVFSLLLFLGFGAFAALLIASVCGILFNFQTIGRLVFRRLDARMLLRFFAVYIVVFVVNWAALKALMDLGASGYLAQAVLVPLVAVMSFLGHKFFVFNARYCD